MSGPRQGLWRLLRHDTHRAGRWWHFGLAAFLVLLSLPVFAALVLIARLWSGPLDVTDTTRRLLASDVPGLSVRQVRLAWNGWREGSEAPVGLLLDDVRLEPPAGSGQIAHASVSLDLVALLRGQARLIAATVRDSSIVLYRRRDNTVALQPSGPAQTGRGDTRPASGSLDLGHLRDIGLVRSTFILHDAASGQTCRADISDLAARPLKRAGVAGGLSGTLSCGGATVALHANGREQPGGTILWHISSDPVNPASLARRNPALAPLAGLDLPLSLAAEATLSRRSGFTMLPHALHLTVRLGAGTIHPGAPEGAGIPVQQGLVQLALTRPERPDGAMQARLSDATLALAGGPDAPVVHLQGILMQAESTIRASLRAWIARVDFAELQHYWPDTLARGAERWVTGNITAGTARNLAVALRLSSGSGWNGLQLAGLSGTLDGSDLTLHWLRPIAPLRGMDGHLVLEGPDSLRIESRHATEDVPGHGSIAVGPATIRITGLTRPLQVGVIDLRLRGRLPDVLTVLAHPRLRLLSRHPLPFTNPEGTVDAHLGLSLPLIDTVTADQIPIHTDVTLAGVHLGNVALGRGLDDAGLTLSAGNDGLKLRGSGLLDGMPSELSYAMDFRPGGPAQVTENAHALVHVTDALLRQEGLDPAGRVSGDALLDLGYNHRRSGAARVALSLDLTQSGLDATFWRKKPGIPAQASAVFGLRNGRLVSIGALHATGPDLDLDGHAEIASGHPYALVIDRFAVGRSRGEGRIDLPQAGTQRPLHLVLRGDALDIVPYLGGTPAPAAPAPGTQGPAAAAHPAPAPEQGTRAASEGTPWRVDLDFRKVLFTATRAFSGVTLHAEAKGVRLSRGRLEIGGPTPVAATLSPDGRNRRVTLDAPDAGALLSALGVGDQVEGGVLHMEGRMEDRPPGTRPNGSRLTALATVGRFTIHNAPLAARLARDLSIYGFVTGASQRQIVVTRFEVPFTMEGDRLELTGARASNAALGATLRGPVDLGQDTLDLRGTVVPSYLFNALPGRLPGVGKMFSPEKGGGLLAATLSITGPMDRPRLRVNPLAMLAPGILRRLLFD